MNKVEAVKAIYSEGREERKTNQRAQRVAQALKVLGLSKDEVIECLEFMDICKSDGEPYHPEYIKRTW